MRHGLTQECEGQWKRDGGWLDFVGGFLLNSWMEGGLTHGWMVVMNGEWLNSWMDLAVPERILRKGFGLI